MTSTIYYLIGATATLRRAVAEEIGNETGAKVVDNQDIYAPIFNVIEHGNIAELPDAAWAAIDAVRGAVLRSIETISPKDWSFVFTHAGLDISADVGVYHTVRATAIKRGAHFVPVTLVSGAPKQLLSFDEANALVVDASSLAPPDVARKIVTFAG